MTSARDHHIELCNAASLQVVKVKDLIGALSDECRVLLQLVGEATGGHDSSDAGREAFEHAALLEVAVTNDPTRLAEVVDAEMVRYANGF